MRQNGKRPRLVRRKGTANFYFKTYVRIADGKYRTVWHSTGTSDRAKAGRAIDAYLESESYAKLELGRETRDAKETAEKMVEHITSKGFGIEINQIPIDSGYEMWKSLPTDRDESSYKNRSHQEGIYRRFSRWAKSERQLTHFDQTSKVVAVDYASFLWKLGITPGTYNKHISFLCRLYGRLDGVHTLRNRNPFVPEVIPRKKSKSGDVAPHQAIEPDALTSSS